MSLNRFSLHVIVPILLVVCLLAGVAEAHPGHHHPRTYGFSDGLLHPVTGLDHCYALLAVGLWASQLGGRATWTFPLAFLGMMAFGGILGLLGVPLPYVDQGVLTSVLILGLLIAVAARFPLFVGLFVVGTFAVFHGYMHAVELRSPGGWLAYGLGFLATSALLMGIGSAASQLFIRTGLRPAIRISGVAIALAGLVSILS